MKTGFTNAFVNKPLTKYYSYHGIIKPCNVQPNPDPFEDFPNTYTECVWEVIYDTYFQSSGTFFYKYKASDFFPSSDNDPCPAKFPDGKARYYFAEVTLLNRFGSGNTILIWNSGLICNFDSVLTTDLIIYKAWFDRLWAGSNVIIMSTPAKLPSHLRVWRTICGEFNPNWPVPPT